jgi:tetratricopeptide (TPR) repeat protein
MLRNRRFEKEINAIKEQIASQGESADLLNNLGYCYREIRELDEARRILRHAVSIDSNKAIIHTNLGNVYFEFGQYQQALEEYRKAKVLEPDSVGVDKNIRIVLEQLR